MGHTGLLGFDHKVITTAHMANVAGLLDDLQGLIPENAIAIGCEECTNAALAQAKSHISLIHLCFLL
jgi:hypothetical protein